MSVVTMYLEEFPEHAAACAKAFAGTTSSTTTPRIKPNTTPCPIAVADDEKISDTLKFAASAFAAVAREDLSASTPRTSATPKAAIIHVPNGRSYTMEDVGQNSGELSTAARAAKILSELIDDEDEPVHQPPNGRTTGRYGRPCVGGLNYCC